MRFPILLAFAAAACSKHGSEPAATGSGSAVEPGSASVVSAGSDGSASGSAGGGSGSGAGSGSSTAALLALPASASITLADDGKEPRKALKYHLPVGKAAELDFTIDSQMMGQRTPTLTMTTTAAVDEVLPNGDMKLHITIGHVSAKNPANPSAADMLTSKLAETDGATMTARLDTSGGVHDIQLSLADGKTAGQDDVGMVTQAFSYLTLQLPVEPVGVGAVWRHGLAFRGAGMKTVATTTIEITSIQGDRIGFKMTTELKGPKQSLGDDTTSIELDGITGSGGGSGDVDLSTLATHATQTNTLHATWTTNGSASGADAIMQIAVSTPATKPTAPTKKQQ